jgi:hypothetical protein
MSLRIRSVLELPQAIRERVRQNLAPVAPRPVVAALRRATLAEERERLVSAMLFQLATVNLAQHFVREYQFDAVRRWRFDLYTEKCGRLGIELQGGVQLRGRNSHTGKDGYQRDRIKINAAIELGIGVLEYTPEMIADGSALAQIERMLA